MEYYIGKSKITYGLFSYGCENILIKEAGEGKNLTIGNFCSIAPPLTVFLGAEHRSDWITTYPFGHIHELELGTERFIGHPHSKGNVIIGHDVWIGYDVTIMSGVSIGDGAIIGSKSLVTKDVLPYQIVGGNPARTIRNRFGEDIIKLLLKLKWWDLPIEEIKKIKNILSNTPSVEIITDLIKQYRN